MLFEKVKKCLDYIEVAGGDVKILNAAREEIAYAEARFEGFANEAAKRGSQKNADDTKTEGGGPRRILAINSDMTVQVLRNSCLENCAPDEPIFVLVGRDVTAPARVRDWVEHGRIIGLPAAKLNDALKIANDMESWQRRNFAKRPD